MPAVLILLTVLVLVPLAEIALFIEVGGRIGLWPTLGLTVATAFAGTLLIRLQGIAVIERVKRELDRGELPVQGLVDALCLAFAGMLLLTPGFFTDAIGALLLLPPIRALLYHRVRAAVERRRAKAEEEMRRRGHGPARPAPPVIETDYEEIPEREETSDRGRIPKNEETEVREDDDMPPPGGGWGPR